MKPRLLLISDLWGNEKSEWIKNYINNLNSSFKIQFYDSCDLGNVDTSDYREKNLHRQFVNGGINTALERLLVLEKEKVNVLAFSIGGTIAWKAALLGLKTDRFYAISSTRLRYETEKPNCHTQLYFGEKDFHQPNLDWQANIGVKPYIFKGKEHKLYTEMDCIEKVCDQIKSHEK